MKRLSIPLLLVALALAGCASDKSVLQGGTSLTATVQNPVGRKELAVVENAYGLALVAAVNYRRLGICKTGTVESFGNPCARRDVVLQLQAADRKARSALIPARRFVRNNPTLNAFSAIAAAQAAVADFQTVLSTNGVR